MNSISLGRKVTVFGASAALAFGSLFAMSAPASAAEATPLFLSFEDNDINGPLAAGGSFSGTSAAITAVPAGGQASGKGLAITKNGDPWSGVNVLLDRTERWTNADNKIISMDYYSPDNVDSPFMVKLDGAGAARKYVVAVPGWNHFDFDMSTAVGWNADAQYPTLAVFPNFADGDLSPISAQPNTGQVYYIDNLSLNGGTISNVATEAPAPRVAASLLLTFEDNDDIGALATGTAEGDGVGTFEGAPGNEIATAPAGGNGGNALQFTKAADGNPWSGFTVVSDSAGTNKFGSSDSPIITTNFHNSSSASIPVMIKVEGGGGAARKYVMAVPGWSTLSFDMSSGSIGWSGSAEYTKVSFFPNFADGDLNAPAAQANTGQIYFFDNIAFNGATTPAIPVVVVKTAQTIGTTAATMKAKKMLSLRAKTSANLTIKWTSRTKSICVIAGTSSAPKVKSLKVGTCKITGTNAGNSTKRAVTTYRNILVKK